MAPPGLAPGRTSAPWTGRKGHPKVWRSATASSRSASGASATMRSTSPSSTGAGRWPRSSARMAGLTGDLATTTA
eukprot:12761656-Alexandrium_andersonii.AAC.1